MSDVHTPDKRHRNMAAIRAKDTKPEIIVRKYLWSRGFRYRLNHPRLPGKPDIVLRKYRTPYSLETNKNELYVRVSKEWKEFFSVNEDVLRRFVYDELARYLHVSNSDKSKDGILEMLSGILSQG